MAVERLDQAPGRPTHREAGQGRARAARGRDRRARPALLSGGRADRFGRRIRRAAPALRGDRGALSRICARSTACRCSVGAAPSAQLRQGAPRGADAVARQRLQRRGRRRLRRPHPPLPAARRRTRSSPSPPSRRSTACRCRCATRTASSSPPPRAATAPRARTSPPTSARSRTCRSGSRASDVPDGLRGARRGLHDQGRLPRAQRAAGGGRRAALRQSAQLRRRLAAPARPGDHRLAPARLLRLCLGRDERDAGRHAVRHGQVVRSAAASRPIR